MRARIVSDLHFDLHRDDGHSLVDSILSWSPEECLIIAGDLCELRNFFPSISRAFRRLVQPYEHVIYIMGNHEYYGRSPKEVLAGCANIRRLFPSVRIPEDCSTIEIAGGKRMHCATLWFADHPLNTTYKKYLSDFSVIRNFDPWVYAQNTQALDFLFRKTQHGDIILTHHLPSYRCIGERYANDNLNRFFVSDCDHIIDVCEPSLWIHGHSHEHSDIMIEQTRVLRNPFGYPHEIAVGFRDLVVDI